MLELALLITFVIILLIALIALGWAFIQRGVLLGRIAEAEGARQSADEAARQSHASEIAAQQRSAALEADLKTALAELREISIQASSLSTQVEHLEARRREDIQALERQHASALAHAHALAAEKITAAEQIAGKTREALTLAEGQLKAVFNSLAGDALRGATQQFLEQAKSTFAEQRVISRTDLEGKSATFTQLAHSMDKRLQEAGGALETLRTNFDKQQATITERLRNVEETSGKLRDETGKLVKALREPHVRGRYGEIQLRRVAELAGMRNYCDFVEQDSQTTADGQVQRPDMVIKLPNGRELVVDAKANLKPYIDAMEAGTPEEIERHLQRFADGVAEQAKQLAGKGYWANYKGSPEFVLMFLPGDQFVDAALARHDNLLDHAAAGRVIIVSPSSLIAMLRAVAIGFQEQLLSEKAREIVGMVSELRNRLAITLAHVAGVGEKLQAAMNGYNEFVGSYERRVLPQMQRIDRAGIQSIKPLPEIKPLDATARGSAAIGLFSPSETPDTAAPNTLALPADAEPSP